MAKEKESAKRIPHNPPVILPVEANVPRPIWSVMIPVYNCSAYLEETLRSVLTQDGATASMQVEVVDDCSTDTDVKALVDRVGEGRIQYYRQPENVGSLQNFKTCLDRSRGYLIHILHGDDKIRPDFYRRFELFFKNHPNAGAAFCRYVYINDKGKIMYYHEREMEREGILTNWVTKLCERQRIQYVSMVVKRKVYEKLGGFYGVEYGEDWEMWVRIAAQYNMGYIPDVLAEYRRHFSSISGKSFLTGKNMEELSYVMEKIQRYIPESEPRRSEIIKRSRKFYSHYAIRIANTLWKELKHKSGAAAQVKAAWRMNKDFKLFYKIVKLYTRITLNV